MYIYMNLLEEVNRPLSNFDILDKMDNKTNIMSYSDLQQFNNINDILGNYKKCVILYQTSADFGHWCCIYEIDNTIYFFDSYGIIPDNQINFVPTELKKELYEDHRHLTKLLYNSNKNIEYNQYQLQNKNININTCGRWCIIRLLYPKISIDNFNKIFNKFNDLIKKDELITLLTL